MTRFDPAHYDVFEYASYAVEPASGTITCHYRLAGAGGELGFTEEFVVGPIDGRLWDGARGEAIRRVARLLWLAAGLSYWKAAAAPVVRVPTALTPAEQVWFEALYREGLGEFAFGNGIDLTQRPRFEVAATTDGEVPLTGLGLPRRALVPVGGGKDSCVTIDVLQEAGQELVLFNIGGHRSAREVAEACDLPLTVAARRLDPLIGELNARGALNGHVPVTSIVSLVAIAQALVTGADHVVFSNERSANVANFVHNGLPVNHQYSKGLDAESRLRAALASVTPELEYYSLLRPLSELHIAEIFARSDRFLPVFTSCNAAFRLDHSRRVERWCASCPKCRFVFLALAPFVGRERLVEIFGADLLADADQLDGFRELVGLTGYKPFECVGEIEESRVAVRLVAEAGGWAGAAVHDALRAELEAAGLAASDELVAAAFAPSAEHLLPPDAVEALGAALDRVPSLGGAS